MRRRASVLAFLTVPAAAVAAPPFPVHFTIPAGPLASAIEILARQSGIDIGGLEPLDRTHTPGFSGTMQVDRALARLLGGTPFTAEPIGPGGYRIVRRRVTVRAAAAVPRSSASEPTGIEDIVVTGGKRDVPLSAYPGSARVIAIGDDPFGPHGADGQAFLLRQTPILQSTELGPGRNKLFIRGIADSSFTGPTQATAGTYFGEVRTGYNGPDPNLNLFDVERIEILEGPQGALYGAGSLGGIIRLTPHAPDLTGLHAKADLGISQTAHGGLGYDGAAMVNWAPFTDVAAIRVVAYRSVDAGYINDPLRGLSNINRMTDNGFRVTARVQPADGWTVDGGYLTQSSHQPDLQYTLIEQPPLERRSAIAQPFEDDYQLGRVVVTKEWDSGLRFVSATGRVAHDTEQRYDATRNAASPIGYDERTHIRLTTQEARLSRTLADGSGWLIGASYIKDSTIKSRQFGMLEAPRDLIGVTNRTDEKAAFASATEGLGRGIMITVGGRFTNARTDGEPSATPASRNFIRGRSSSRVDPEAGITVPLMHRIALFAQYQQGFRTGGLAVARGIGRVANYESDKIYVGEGGVRLSRSGATGLAAVAAVSFARWKDIQADLVSQFGFPYTANVGDGRILSFEGSIDWRPIASLSLIAGLFLNHSRLVNPAPDFLSSGRRPLPDTPSTSGTAAITWTRDLSFARLRLAGNARYVGSARLGVGPVLDLPYGNYLQTGVAASLLLRRVELSLSIDNVLDTRGNRFAIGNPFGVAYRDEVTPLRPRTIRLGIKTGL